MKYDKMERVDGGPDAYECNACEQVLTFEQLKDIEDLLDRISAGEMVPAGECPDCGALSHPMGRDEWFAWHRRVDPHCTCTDCLEEHEKATVIEGEVVPELRLHLAEEA